MPSDMRTVWIPAESYRWVWLPLASSSTVPSPQSMAYVPRAGTVMDSPGAVVLHVVTKSDSPGAYEAVPVTLTVTVFELDVPKPPEDRMVRR